MIPRSNMSPLYRNHYYKESVQRDRLQMTPSESWPHMFRLKITTYEALALPSLSSRTELQNSHDWHTLQRHQYTLFLQIQHRSTLPYRCPGAHDRSTLQERTPQKRFQKRQQELNTRGEFTRMTREDLLGFVDRCYSPDNTVVAVAGPIDHEAIVRRVTAA